MREFHKFLSICLLLFAGCDDEFCKRRMEIVPGLVWEYYSIRHSRVVSDKYGILADGDVFVTFNSYGLNISGGIETIYIDLAGNVIDSKESTQILIGAEQDFGTFDAGYAMGMFTKESHKDYLAEMEALKKRVEEKMKRERLRRL